MSDKVYNALKWIVTVVFPAIGTFYFVMSGIWGWPYAEQVVGTITALVTLLGVILGISNAQYKKCNDIVVTPKEHRE